MTHEKTGEEIAESISKDFHAYIGKSKDYKNGNPSGGVLALAIMAAIEIERLKVRELERENKTLLQRAPTEWKELKSKITHLESKLREKEEIINNLKNFQIEPFVKSAKEDCDRKLLSQQAVIERMKLALNKINNAVDNYHKCSDLDVFEMAYEARKGLTPSTNIQEKE